MTLASGASESLTGTTKYVVTSSIQGNASVAGKTASATYTTYYPIYTFVANTTRVDAIPSGATKQAVRSTPTGATYTYGGVASGNYLYIAFPSSMSISDASQSGFSVGMVE